ncbi:hypothetical protein FPRO05_08356 [Fusarium proliferatum]|uniref:Uncharacterized protein n=1 Tax=Gibberella intermedia TaxID=948311 RepID=A0A365NJA6_GIBIN|nr:hypothetical protein FPRO05_08356 [Fusarium proliferatum]
MYFSNIVVGALAAQAMSGDRRPTPALAGKFAALMAAAALPVSGVPVIGLIEPRSPEILVLGGGGQQNQGQQDGNDDAQDDAQDEQDDQNEQDDEDAQDNQDDQDGQNGGGRQGRGGRNGNNGNGQGNGNGQDQGNGGNQNNGGNQGDQATATESLATAVDTATNVATDVGAIQSRIANETVTTRINLQDDLSGMILGLTGAGHRRAGLG